MTKKLTVFNKEDGLYYQYDGGWWQVKTTLDIFDDIIGFCANLKLMSVESKLKPYTDGNLINLIKEDISIENWPSVSWV